MLPVLVTRYSIFIVEPGATSTPGVVLASTPLILLTIVRAVPAVTNALAMSIEVTSFGCEPSGNTGDLPAALAILVC